MPRKRYTKPKKVCKTCLEEKWTWDFYKARTKAGNLTPQPECKVCMILRARKYQAERPDDVLRIALKNRYNMTIPEYNKLLLDQGNVCAICKGVDRGPYTRLQVDHDHQYGFNRGLLCNNCNKGLGQFMDNKDILEAAKQYLMEWEY
jgi:hypothetical protein